MAGFRAPSPCRPRAKKPEGLGAKGTGEQGMAGFLCTNSAPSADEKAGGTWCKGNGGARAGGFSCTNSAPAAGEKTGGTWCKGNGRTRAGGFSCTKSVPAASEKPAQAVEEKARAGRRRPIFPAAPAEVYKLPYDNKSVLKGNFFCGIILSPERGQRCDTGNNMKGDAI